MGFFFNDQRDAKPKRTNAPAKARRLEDIPVTLLRQQSCTVCPRDKDTSMRTPKLLPEGPRDAPIYLLGGIPSAEDDRNNAHWTDPYGVVLCDEFRGGFMRDYVRSNFVVQCRGEAHVAVTECCRGRIERDIEETKPRIVMTIGDDAFRWATGMTANAAQMRGTMYVGKFGSHVCYVYATMTPNYIKRYNKHAGDPMSFSRFELAFKHDIKWVKDNFDKLPPPTHYAQDFDKHIELLTGDQPGDIHRLEKRLREIAQYPEQALDLETSGLRPYMQRHPAILTAAVGTFKDTLAFPLRISSAGHDEGWGTTAREQRAMELFAEFLQYSGRKTCHNAAFEMEWIAHDFGPEILRRTEWDDTMAMAYTMDSRSTKSLDVQVRMHFGFYLKDMSPVNVKLEQWWLKYPLKTILRYNGMDTKWTDALRTSSARLMGKDEWSVYLQRMRLAPTLVLTEAPGLLFDEDYARKLASTMQDQLASTEAKLSRCKEVKAYEQRYGHFEPTNTDQVLKLMYDMLKRPECKREDRDGEVTMTTDEEALSAIPSHEVPSAPLILNHREVFKQLSTYVLPAIQKKWVGRGGRIRAKYNALLTVTSRLSADDPNVTNWPKRKHREVRGMVRADRGHWLVPADYGQIEFRVVGMASHDENLVKYCWTGYDVHKYWAQRAMKEHPAIVDWVLDEFADTLALYRKQQGKEYDEDAAILKTLRQEFKNKWVFPQLFGAATHSCAMALHLPDDAADVLAGEFWDEFRGVKKWQQEQVDFYKKHLYVQTLGGFKRRGLMTINELINLPIQGTAAEIVQESHIALSERADMEGDSELQPIINVHDDLTFSISDATLEQKIDIIAREMCKLRFDYINVPLIVEVSVGERWDTTQEYKVFRSDVLYGTPNPYA